MEDKRQNGEEPAAGQDRQAERSQNTRQDPAAEEFPEVLLEPIEELGVEGVERKRPRPARKNGKKKKRQDRRITIVALLCSVILVAAGILTYMLVTAQRQKAAEIAAQLAAEEELRIRQEQQKAEFEQMANSTVFLDGITVEGVAIGGMTMAEAKEALAPAAEAAGKRGELQLTVNGQLYSLDINPLLTASNLNSVLSEAYRLGKTGDYAAMKAKSEEIKANGKAYSLTAGCDLAGLRAKVAELAAQVDTPAKDAAVSSVDTDNRTILFSDEAVGIAVQQEELVQDILELLQSDKTDVLTVPVLTTNPVVTKADLSAKYVKRGSATTSFSDSSKERKYNIRKGAGMINGTVLKAGETFSTNDTLGTRTTGKGWQMAGAYESGATVEQAGGGVCQLSTTLYNAIVKSDLEVVSRRNHSMPVGYIDKGLDATINSVGNIIDFKFKNNTASDIVVFGYTTDNKTLTFEIWGVPFATDEYDEIKLTSKQQAVYEPESDPVRLDMPEGAEKPNGKLLAAGEEYVAVTPRKGYLYQSYKNYYKNGELVRTENLASSTYKAFNGEIWVCTTLATPEPTPEDVGVVDPGFDPGAGGDAGAVTEPIITPDAGAFYN